MTRLALLLALTFGTVSRADAFDVTDAPRPTETRRLYPLAIGGIALLAGGWVGSIYEYFQVLDCRDGALLIPVCTGTSVWTLVPVVGNWVVLAFGEVRGDHVLPALALGTVQVVGLALTVIGFVVRVPISKEVGTLEASAAGVTF